MAHVKNILGLLEQLQSVDITVHQNRCVVVRNRNASCTKCADACTSGCISYQSEKLVISPEKCIGCGTCATVCPTCALEAHHPNDKELYEACVQAMQNNNGEAVIACETLLEAAYGLYDPDRVVGVKCLGRVEESLLILLSRAGAKRIVLVQGGCDECRQNPGSAIAELVCGTANALLDTWNKEKIVCITNKLPHSLRRDKNKSYDASKRGFLTNMFETAKTTAQASTDFAIKETLNIDEVADDSPSYQRVQEDGTLPHFLPHRQSRLLKGLSYFGEPQDIMIDTRLWGHAIIDPALCTSCQMCATFCPTEALKKFKDPDGTFGVKHYPGKCVRCRCCTDICASNAITISHEIFAVDLFSKAYERYEMSPRKNPLGPHQMMDSMKKLVGDEYIYER